MSERARIALLVGFATLGLVIALGAGVTSERRIVAAYLLALAAIALASLMRAISHRGEARPVSQFEHALVRRAIPPGRPTELVVVERDIALGAANAGHLHARLLPRLREAAEARLGIDFGLRPELARTRVGDDAWELLRPDRPVPEDLHAPGLTLRRIRDLVGTVERL